MCRYVGVSVCQFLHSSMSGELEVLKVGQHANSDIFKKFKNIKNVKRRNGHSNHQKVKKQVTMYKIPHKHITTEAMTTYMCFAAFIPNFNF